MPRMRANLEVRRHLIGRPRRGRAHARRADPPAPHPSRAAHELVVAGIAMRRLRTTTARAALALAERAARDANIPALTAEVESASLVMSTPAARLIARGEERPLLLEEVEAPWRRRRWSWTPAAMSCGTQPWWSRSRRARYCSRLHARWVKPARRRAEEHARRTRLPRQARG